MATVATMKLDPAILPFKIVQDGVVTGSPDMSHDVSLTGNNPLPNSVTWTRAPGGAEPGKKASEGPLSTLNFTVANSEKAPLPAVTFTVADPVGANALTVKLPEMVDEGNPPLPPETEQVGGEVAEKRLVVVDDITQVLSLFWNPVP